MKLGGNQFIKGQSSTKGRAKIYLGQLSVASGNTCRVFVGVEISPGNAVGLGS